MSNIRRALTEAEWDARLRARLVTHTRREGECLVWTGSPDQYGYGKTSGPNGSSILAHRLAYTLLVGPIPDGLVIDHLCRNRLCVRVEHLEVVSRGENTLRGHQPHMLLHRANRCAQGHPFTPENTYLRPGGGRTCRECQAAVVARYKQRRRELGAA